MITKEDITAFLNQEKIAFAGVSRDSRKFSNNVYRTLKESGHKVYPINPNTGVVEGDQTFPDIKSLPESMPALMIVSSPKVALQVLKDVEGSGIDRIWIFTGPGNKTDLNVATEQARSSGLTIISGLCPRMFVEPVGFPHTIHRFIMRVVGSYPK